VIKLTPASRLSTSRPATLRIEINGLGELVAPIA
jgi:hypothetical protein